MAAKQQHAMADRLNNEERGELQDLIARIKENSDAVLTDLATIHQKRLYREFGSFRDFVQSELGMSKSRAYQLLQECEVRQNLSQNRQKVSTIVDTLPPSSQSQPSLPLPATEGQIRPLVKLPPQQQAAVWADAVDLARERGHTAPTAAIVEETVKLHQEQAEPYREQPADGPEAAEPAAPLAMKDAHGQDVPACLAAVWGKAKQLDNWSRQLSDILREVKEFAAEPEMGAYLDMTVFERDVRNCKHALKFAKPYIVCNTCHGTGCTTCRETGWLPQTSMTRNAPLHEEAA
jgi:hypothetical protein